jgi:spore maturation protein CgeB
MSVLSLEKPSNAKMMTKILINAPRFYGIDEAIRESFETIGFNAILLNYGTKTTIQEKIARRIGLKNPNLKLLLNPILKYYLEKENNELINTIKKEKPDLLFIIKGDHLFPETLKKIRNEISCPIIAYIWDDPFYSYAGLFSDDFRKSNFEKGMHLYDFIFVYDTYYAEQIKKRGIINVEYLPLAADPKRYRKIEIGEEDSKTFGYDICFVGVPHPNRIEILESLKHYNLGVFGDGWSKYFLQKGQRVPSYYRGKAIGEKVLKIYLSSKIVLNIHDPEAREGLNTRTFDILACGASELVDYKKNLEMHFKIGEEIVTFKDKKELLESVNYYLENNGLLKDISNKGRQRVLNEHTWAHRVNRVINTIKERGIVNAHNHERADTTST